ncbi:MAG: hypothetical protein AAGD11_03740 [Planctomycetota bacterium]
MRQGRSVPTKCLNALLAIQFAAISATGTPLGSQASAHPGHDDEQCAPQGLQEKSIVISAKKLTDDDATSESDDGSDGVLKPIAKVSKREPDLAEPLEVAQVPTPAEVPDAEQQLQPIAADSTTADSTTQSEQPTDEYLTMAETEVISFHGITPGLSKRINVLRTWGDPRSDDTQADELKYRFDNLPAVRVRFADNLVEAIEVELAKPTAVATLIGKMNLQQIRPVTLREDGKTATAMAYPERGVLLRYASEEIGLTIASDSDADETASPRIGKILLQPISAELFLARAKSQLNINYTNAIADLVASIKLDGKLGVARGQLSELYSRTGGAVAAERYAAEAVDVEPQNATLRLQWAKCLRQLARYDRAVEEIREVLETADIAPLVRARALHEMGMLASLGSKVVARRATKLHSKAIEIADNLAVGSDRSVRLPAKELLVEAHLAVAVEISRGSWQQKDETVPQWIERASALAEALIEEDEAYLPLRLRVAVSALAAASNLEKPINPLLWVEEAEETVAEIKQERFDVKAVSQYEWQLGLAYFHGAQIQHRRSEPESAIHLGELADQQLAELSLDRDEMPDTSYLMGRLYFQLGAVHAVHYEDHVTACQWYDDAVDRLLNPVPVTTMAAPQQHGDALVSMGVSYWHQEDRQRAIEVTKAGVELIEQAVSSGLLEEDTLMVSYNNLSAMHQAQGDREPAARYERLAKQVTGAKVTKKEEPKSAKRR